MADDLTSLEHRIDRIESWREAEEAVAAEKSAAATARHTILQLTLSVLSTLTMLVNFYLTLHHSK